MLDNRLSHPLLKPLLSNLQDLVHDTAERVRVALLDVLILVKGLKAIKVCKAKKDIVFLVKYFLK